MSTRISKNQTGTIPAGTVPVVQCSNAALLLLRQLLVDQLLEGVDRLRADEAVAVDEERRRAVGARLRSFLGVLLHAILVGARVEVLLELVHVQTDLRRVLLQVRPVEGLLVG